MTDAVGKAEWTAYAAADGGYVMLPHAVSARRDLTAVAKLVYAELADHLRPGPDREVSPSVARLAERTGSGKTAVMEAIASLEAAGLVIAARARGRRTTYRFTLPTSAESGPVRNPDRSENHTTPVRKTHHTGPENGPEEDVKPFLEDTTPPTPPASGGDDDLAGARDGDGKATGCGLQASGTATADGDGNGDGTAKRPEADGDGNVNDLVSVWEAAYHAHHGTAMPWRGWSALIHRDYSHDAGAGPLAEVTVADFATAADAAHASGHYLTFRRVVRAIEARLADALKTAQRAEAKRRAHLAAEVRQAADEAWKIHLTDQQLAAFRSLPKATRDGYVARITEESELITRADLVEQLAARTAWKQRDSQPQEAQRACN